MFKLESYLLFLFKFEFRLLFFLILTLRHLTQQKHEFLINKFKKKEEDNN